MEASQIHINMKLYKALKTAVWGRRAILGGGESFRN